MSKIEELYDQVCEKLDKEAEGVTSYQVIAQHLKERCRGDVGACMAMLEEKKTLAGAYEAIRKEAESRYQKDRTQKGVCITFDEGCEIVDRYYGLNYRPGGKPVVSEKKPDEQTAGKVVSLFDMF